MRSLKPGIWFNNKLRRSFSSFVKIGIICTFGIILLQLNSCAVPPNTSPPISNQKIFGSKLPFTVPGPGNVNRGRDLYFCGKEKCDKDGKLATAGCNRSECHSDTFDTSPVKNNSALQGASKKNLYELLDCMYSQMEFNPTKNDPGGVDCKKQKEIFKGFTEQDFRDLAAFLSSKDTNKYTVSGVIKGNAGLSATVVATSDYLPNVTVKAKANGEYTIETLAAGDYQITPKLDKYYFVPILHSVVLEFYLCIAEDSKEATSDSYSHKLKNVNFVQKKNLFDPNYHWHPK